MKKYLRGLGVGIVVTAFILSISGANKNEKLTDIQIIQKAQELGMVTEDEFNSVNSELSDVKANINDLKSKLENVDESQNTQENSSDAQADQNTETAIEDTSNTTESTSNNVTTQETNIDGSVSETTTVNFDIIPGMGSESVAKLLEQKGIIDSASEFNNYIVDTGNANNLQVGEYNVTTGDSYDTILGKLIGR
jgi:hypothetical protein